MSNFPLKRQWTLWYDSLFMHPSYDHVYDYSTWISEISKIYTFGDISDFWKLFNNIAAPSEMEYKSSYYLFDSDSFYDTPQIPYKIINIPIDTTADDLWIYTVVFLISESISELNEVYGISIMRYKMHVCMHFYSNNSPNLDSFLQIVNEKIKNYQ